jgi:hypothetical protein
MNSKKTNKDSNEKKTKDEILIQHAQKCFVCNDYLYGGQDTVKYQGKQHCFTGWIIHTSCSLSIVDKKE